MHVHASPRVIGSTVMTRQQVARRLGKSLATIRRIEGVLLHPTKDSRGVHHFDIDEVEALAHRTESGQLSLCTSLTSDPGSDCPNCEVLERQLSQLRGELEENDNHNRQALAALRAERQREKAQHDAERRELEQGLAEFVAIAESLID